jgi:hypothetical protein
MANGLLRNVTVPDFAGNPRVIQMTDFVLDQQDQIEALQSEALTEQFSSGGGTLTSVKVQHRISKSPENPNGAYALVHVTSTGAVASQNLLTEGAGFSIGADRKTITFSPSIPSDRTVTVVYHPELDAIVSILKATYPAR